MNKTVKQERKTGFMKKTLKSFIAFMLCAAAIITNISAGTGTVCAAGKKIPLKVGFNGKEIVLVNNLNSANRQSAKIKAVEKKWGKSQKVKKSDPLTFYTWKKGKTSIEICDDGTKEDVGAITIKMKDTNGSLCGVKVGMKKSAALNKLKKLAGSKNVLIVKDGQEVSFDEEKNKYVVEGEPTGKGEYISLYSEYMPVDFELKNGKVSSISWMRS